MAERRTSLLSTDISSGVPAELVLEDGTKYQGISFGAETPTAGDVTFHTGMLGHPESLTDPSYRNQIVVLTYPVVANNGVPADVLDLHRLSQHFESQTVHAAAVVVSRYYEGYSHWRATRSLSQWLRQNNIPGLYGIDTRAIAKKLRSTGSMRGKILFPGFPGKEDVEYPDPSRNLIAEVSTPTVFDLRPLHYHAKTAKRILAVDTGLTNTLIRLFLSFNVQLRIVPFNYDFMEEEWDGLFVSSGPGNPAQCTATIENIRKALALPEPKPILGIGLGHQLLGLAIGAKTYAMKYGNRGLNHPCMDLRTGRCYVTCQNHSYAVAPETLPAGWKTLFVNLNDRSVEGLIHEYKPFFSIQFNPNAEARPADTEHLIQHFLDSITGTASVAYTMPLLAPMNIRKVLLLGSGSQAGQYDYLACQAAKALSDEQIDVVIMNPNVATVNTAKENADKVYFLPITPQFVEDVIVKEKPDAILLIAGGQAALRCGLELFQKGVLAKHNVSILGSSARALEVSNDRAKFAQLLEELGEKTVPTRSVTSATMALKIANEIGYPVVVRTDQPQDAFYGSAGVAYDSNELRDMVEMAISRGQRVNVEKSLKGWKQVEYEVLRDWMDNCISVCDMEGFDPVGIHPGDSIITVPSQTLGSAELALLQTAALKIIRHLDIVGECNVRFALRPGSEEYCVVEMSSRFTHSTALASKATAYPLAYVATKLCLQKSLTDLTNTITKTTTACFEPSLDYCVVKVPCWTCTGFESTCLEIGSEKRSSIGEVMAVGRSFEEALHKAVRMAYPESEGLEGYSDTFPDPRQSSSSADGAATTDANGGLAVPVNGKAGRRASPRLDNAITNRLVNPTNRRIFYVMQALLADISIDDVYDMTKIDRWFLQRLRHVAVVIKGLRKLCKTPISAAKTDRALLLEAKVCGFSDKYIGTLAGASESMIRNVRKSLNIRPYVRQMDTCAGEYQAQVDCLYLTYAAMEHDVAFDLPGYIVLGCGGFEMGTSTARDWSVCRCIDTVRKEGQRVIVVNCNPQAVSTDFDRSDRLYLDELSLEVVLDICELENPKGVIPSVGGYCGTNLVVPLACNGVHVVGTPADKVGITCDKHKLRDLLKSLELEQPPWNQVSSLSEAEEAGKEIGYPLIIRSTLPRVGRNTSAGRIVESANALKSYLSDVSAGKPFSATLTKFYPGAREIEFDGVAKGGEILNYGLVEHVELGGVHAGDGTLVVPAQQLWVETTMRVKKAALLIARALEITGPFKIDFISTTTDMFVCEVALQSSRTLPFVSKVLNIDFVELAAKASIGILVRPEYSNPYEIEYVAVKAPIFSFDRQHGVDPLSQGVELTNTGEVACFGEDLYEAFLLSMIATGFTIPREKSPILLSTGPLTSKLALVESVRTLEAMGYQLYGTPGTAAFYRERGIAIKTLDKTRKGGRIEVVEAVKAKRVNLVVNIPLPDDVDDVSSGYMVRRAAVDYGVSLLTNEKCFKVFVDALQRVKTFQIKTWKEYLNMTSSDESVGMPTNLASTSPIARFPASPETGSFPLPLAI